MSPMSNTAGLRVPAGEQFHGEIVGALALDAA
jgi:hypothetical protein